MKVDALWMIGKKNVEIRRHEIGDPGFGEIQIEVKACGICKWDQCLYEGFDTPSNYPFTFGHEPAGVVLKVGEGVNGFAPGDSVACCGGADSMMQVINVPARSAAVIDGRVEDFGVWVAEPVSCVVNSVANMPFTPAEDILLVGTGYMGLLKLQALNKTMRGRLIALDVDDRLVALAKEFGADEAYNAQSDDGIAAVEKIVKNGGIDVVVECSGAAGGLQTANKCLKNSGILEMFGWQRGERLIDCSPWHTKGIRIFNTAPNIEKNYLPQRLLQTVKLMASGVFDQSKLITHRTNYKHAEEAFERALVRADGYIKGVITFD
jgi:threonine dehydrogenase-like Zn-dependent dehydrogenase